MIRGDDTTLMLARRFRLTVSGWSEWDGRLRVHCGAEGALPGLLGIGLPLPGAMSGAGGCALCSQVVSGRLRNISPIV